MTTLEKYLFGSLHTKKSKPIGASPKGQFSKNTVYLERGIPYFAFVGTNAVLVRKNDKS